MLHNAFIAGPAGGSIVAWLVLLLAVLGVLVGPGASIGSSTVKQLDASRIASDGTDYPNDYYPD